MSASVGSRALLTNRPFLTLLVFRTLSMLGFAFSPVALAFGILHMPGTDAGTLSIVLASQMVPTVVFLLVGGVIADRYPRSRVLIVGSWLSAAAWFSIGAMFLCGNPPVWSLCVAATVAGTATATVYPALSGIIPDLVPVRHRQQGNAWLSMGASGARLAGLVAGGAVVVAVGGGWALVAAGAMYLVAGVLVWTLPPVTHTLATTNDSPIRQLVEGWGEFVSRQWLWVCVVQWSVMMLVLQAAHGVLGPVVAEQELGGAAAWTQILAAEAFGAMVGVVLSLVWRPKRPILAAMLMTTGAGIPSVLLGISAPSWSVMIAAFFMGVGFDLFGVWWMTTMQNEIPAESLSRVSAYDALGSLMLGPVGLVLAGPATVLFGVHPALVVSGIVALATTLFALSFPEVRRLRSREPVPVGPRTDSTSAAT